MTRHRFAALSMVCFFLSLIGARDQGCQAPTLGAPCSGGENVFNCRCTLHYGDEYKPCHATTQVCGTAATAPDRAVGTVGGQQGVTCACTPSGEPPPAYPQTIGGDPTPLCSDVMNTTGAGGSPVATCAAPSDPCDTGIDCCSGLCTLNACE